MTLALAVLSIVLGTVYTGYGTLTVIDLARGWGRFGLSHFGLAWIAMAFTCGPHHLEHGLHVLAWDRGSGALELVAVAVGFPSGVVWFLLRVEALLGGRGERFITGTPLAVRSMPYASGVYAVGFGIGAVYVVRSPDQFPPMAGANVMLIVLYSMIGWYLLRTQLATYRSTGQWSVSGIALTIVFPTCALMHAAWVAYQVAGTYEADLHTVTIDWLAVPAAAYFLWVVRGLHTGTVRDWNQATTGVVPAAAAA